MNTTQQEFEETIRALQQGYDDMKAGRSQPAGEFLRNLRRKHDILIGGSHVQSDSSIAMDQRGVAWLVGANTKVIEVVMDKLAHGWSPEEIHFQHPHLSLAQIHAAFAYYYEHQEEMDQEIVRQVEEVEKLAHDSASSPLRRRLLALKKRR